MNLVTEIEAASRRIRPFILPSYRRAFDTMLARGLKEHRDGEPIVVCDFSNPAIDATGGRYYASMVRDLVDGGFFPVFTARRSTLSSFIISNNKALTLGERLGVIRSLDELKEPYFLMTDRRDPVPALAEKVVRVNYQHRLCRSDDEIELPFFTHPKIGTRVKLPHPYQVEETRTARIFFGGNTTEGRYDKNVIGELYHMLTRREMLALADAVLEGRICRPDDSEKWLTSPEFHPFVMFETQRQKIQQDRWIDALAKADFFLACPGVGMPLCHNLIEALAGGAIPILQYAAYLPVPLEDGKNCVSFHDADSLTAAIKRVLAMDQQEIQAMRANVRAYYLEHQAPGCFARRLFNGNWKTRTLLTNAYRVPR